VGERGAGSARIELDFRFCTGRTHDNLATVVEIDSEHIGLRERNRPRETGMEICVRGGFVILDIGDGNALE
jgi:hypothetical protein